MNTQRINDQEIKMFEKEHIAKARKLAPECMVLLKNNGTLPFGKIKKLALYGSGARRTIKGGTGSGDVNVRRFINVEEGLEQAGLEITTKEWLDAYDVLVKHAKVKYFREIRKQADEMGQSPIVFAMGKTAPEPEYKIPLDGGGDTAVYVLARTSGEGADRQSVKGDIQLTDTEIRDILELNAGYKNFVLLLNTGGMVDLTPVDSVKTVLLMGQLGSATGEALADVLTGRAYPSGKLTMTWAPIDMYNSTEGFGDPNDSNYQEGVYVGYRFFDTAGLNPAYPFGFGLGYTTFEVMPKWMTVMNELITITATVTNTGTSAGKEVVQLYYSAPQGKLNQPYQNLVGYAKTNEVYPGQSEDITIEFSVTSMASYDIDLEAYVLEAGVYYIRVGNCSRNTHIVGAVELDATAVIEKERHICGNSGFEDQKPSGRFIYYEGEDTEKINAQIFELKAANLEMSEIKYQQEPEAIQAGPACTWEEVLNNKKSLEEFIGGLNEEQLADLCIGSYIDSDDLMEIIGNSSKKVAGAAGETTSRLNDLGVPVIVMADGPAGLRLSPDYMIEDGVAKGSDSINGDMFLVYTPEELQEMKSMSSSANEVRDTTIYYQNCTAIPVGTSIAQSWSDRVAEKYGDIVGEEMELFGIQAWLAPAMNIQRSPLCGRNFEYYSEDPYISGCVAANITKGVQKHPGCGTTIKHFACNNQETNRFFSNSNISERALREIYLKGFEICVKKSQPRYIMSSYNLINGVHVCNSKELMTHVLRDEWGFEGAVMTDWLVTGGMGLKGEKWPCASAAGNVKAGNDLTMPGMPSDKLDIMNALKSKEHPFALTRAELQICAKHILQLILENYSETTSN